LERATITTKTKVTKKVRTRPKTIHTADVNTSTTLPRKCWRHDKLSVLFESRHMQWTCSHFL